MNVIIVVVTEIFIWLLISSKNVLLSDATLNSTNNTNFTTALHFRGAYKPCLIDEDCDSSDEVCNRQYVDNIVPQCSHGFCQCRGGYIYKNVSDYDGCTNVCETYRIGDECGDYPTRLLPEGTSCKNNIVTCLTNIYCPQADLGYRLKTFGEYCDQDVDCSSYSLMCFQQRSVDKNGTSPRKVCQCSSDEFTWDEGIGRCRRFSLNDKCDSYCGGSSTLYKSRLVCKNSMCKCGNSDWASVQITVPAARTGVVAYSESFLEITDTITICVPLEHMILRMPGESCDIRNMTKICNLGSMCFPCVYGCPLPICRALLKHPTGRHLVSRAVDNNCTTYLPNTVHFTSKSCLSLHVHLKLLIFSICVALLS